MELNYESLFAKSIVSLCEINSNVIARINLLIHRLISHEPFTIINRLMNRLFTCLLLDRAYWILSTYAKPLFFGAVNLKNLKKVFEPK